MGSLCFDVNKKKKLTQAKAAKILKISQPKISLLLRVYLEDFSLERLLRFLNDLGQVIQQDLNNGPVYATLLK